MMKYIHIKAICCLMAFCSSLMSMQKRVIVFANNKTKQMKQKKATEKAGRIGLLTIIMPILAVIAGGGQYY